MKLLLLIILFLSGSISTYALSLVNTGTFDGVPIDYKVEIINRENKLILSVLIRPSDDKIYYIDKAAFPKARSFDFRIFFISEDLSAPLDSRREYWGDLYFFNTLSMHTPVSKDKPIHREIDLGESYSNLLSRMEKAEVNIAWTYSLCFRDKDPLRKDRKAGEKDTEHRLPAIGGFLNIPVRKKPVSTK